MRNIGFFLSAALAVGSMSCAVQIRSMGIQNGIDNLSGFASERSYRPGFCEAFTFTLPVSGGAALKVIEGFGGFFSDSECSTPLASVSGTPGSSTNIYAQFRSPDYALVEVTPSGPVAEAVLTTFAPRFPGTL